MRSLFRVAVLAIPLAALAACHSASVTTPAMTASFDPNEAAFIKKKGKTKIAGHAFWRDAEGGTQDAAGEIIRLVPSTAYARERFAALYAGKRSVSAGNIPKVEPDPAYADYTRTTRAEANGRFDFDDVAPGSYFVTAQVTWKDKKKFAQQGGAMYESVAVTGKEEDDKVKLVLTNDK